MRSSLSGMAVPEGKAAESIDYGVSTRLMS